MTQASYNSAELDRPPDPSDAAAPDDSPRTVPSNALVPQKPRHFVEALRRSGWRAPSTLEQFATQLFDALDAFADRVANELGIR